MTVQVDAAIDLMELGFRCQQVERALPPRRRLWLEMAVHADDLPTLVESIRSILHNIERGCPHGVSGSPSSGSHFRVLEDVTVSPATYQEALKNYLNMIRAEAGGR